MPLVPEQLDVALTGGLETRTDRRLVQGKLLDLENLTFRNGTLSRREGTVADSNAVVGVGTLLPDALALATVGSEVLRWGAAGVYSRAAATSFPWVAKGDDIDAQPLSYALSPVASRARSCENFDCATLNGVSVYVWTELQGTYRSIRATVVDDATGTRFQDAMELNVESSTGVANSLVRVVASGGAFLVFYVLRNGSTTTVPLRCRRLDLAYPTFFDSEVQLVTDVASSGPATEKFAFDAIGVSSHAFSGAMVAYTYSSMPGTHEVKWIHVTSVGVPAVAVPSYSGREPVTEVLPASIRSLRLFRSATNGYITIACHTDDTATMTSLDAAFDSVNVGVEIATLGGGFLRATALEDSEGNWQAWLEPAPGIADYRLITATWDQTQTFFDTNLTWLHNARLGGDAFTLGTRRVVPLLYHNLLEGDEGSPGVQPTYFLAEAASARVVARVLPGLAGGPLQGVGLARPMPTSSGLALVVPRRQRVEFNDADGVLEDLTAVGLVRMALQQASPASLARLEENGALHVGGACPLYYDGAAFVEDGFHLSPEAVAVTDGGEGNMTAGSRSWVAVYEWVDALGRLHRSGPSIPVRLTFGADNKAASLTVPYLHLTRKSEVRLAVYRTTADGSPTYYRVKPSTESPSALGNTLTATFVDDVADEDILDNEVLYTVGGVLTALPPPAYTFAHQHRGYLWLGGLMDDAYGFAYSLPEAEGEGPSWNDTLTGRLSRETGPLRGFSSVDQTLALFTANSAYVVTGQGPTATGNDNGFSEPVRLTGALGLTDWRALVSIPAGTLHKSPQGFQLLNRGLQVEDFGSGVERYDGLQVVRGLTVAGKDEARFYTAEGRTLVWNYQWGQWSTFTLQPAVDAALVGTAPWYATGTALRYESTSTFAEAGQALSYTFGTSWLKARSLQGVQRVWRVLLLGEAAVDNVQVSLTVYTNYRETPAAETKTQSVSLTAGEPFQFRYGLVNQLAQAHRFVWSLTSAPSGGVDTGTLAITGVTLEVGTDGRTAKLKANKSL